ncbi:hypothetical protein R3P38DRAFT_1452340 [Favolaschia claudopus]|uniref:Uncharacterized protein n=1 Tax=Favolaschia claudopus TaxID=2862362 RepID=A0AAW0AL82_9AGAR
MRPVFVLVAALLPVVHGALLLGIPSERLTAGNTSVASSFSTSAATVSMSTSSANLRISNTMATRRAVGIDEVSSASLEPQPSQRPAHSSRSSGGSSPLKAEYCIYLRTITPDIGSSQLQLDPTIRSSHSLLEPTRATHPLEPTLPLERPIHSI